MDPKTFTLGNMFAMRLHQFGPDISEITNAAIKELTIETELKKLADVWKEQQFDLFKYTKGGMDDRGWILKSKLVHKAGHAHTRLCHGSLYCQRLIRTCMRRPCCHAGTNASLFCWVDLSVRDFKVALNQHVASILYLIRGDWFVCSLRDVVKAHSDCKAIKCLLHQCCRYGGGDVAAGRHGTEPAVHDGQPLCAALCRRGAQMGAAPQPGQRMHRDLDAGTAEMDVPGVHFHGF